MSQDDENAPPKDDPVAEWILAALADGREMPLVEAARGIAKDRAKPKDPPDVWRKYLSAVRQQAVHLARQGRLEILRGKTVVDPNDFKGLVKIRLPQERKTEE